MNVAGPLLFVSGEYPPDVGGVGDYTHRLRSALADLGWPSRVFARPDVGRWDARSLLRLVPVAPSSGIVHIEFQAGAFDLLGDVCLMPLVLRLVRRRARVVTTLHDVRVPYLFPKAGVLRQASVRLLARTSDAVLAADQRDLSWLGPAVGGRGAIVPIGSNVECAPPSGYDRAEFRSALGWATDDFVVAFFGLLNASKGLDLLLDAFRLLLSKDARMRLILLGGQVGASDPTDRATAASVRARLGASGEQVRVTGWLPGAELSAYLLAADVALLPYVDGASARRGSLLACVAHGLPVVSTAPAGPEVAAAVHAVDPEPRRLAQAVLEIAADRALAIRLRDASRALAERVGWPRIAEAHVQIYQRLLLYS